jgi:superfamily I DNA and/or RNA helicase
LNQNNEGQTIIGCKDIDSEFIEYIDKILEQGKKPSIIVAKKDPPFQYLINLRKFVEKNTSDDILNMSIKGSIDSWNPTTIEDRKKLCDEIVSTLESENEVIIQGPPGTGKSTIISEVVSESLRQGYSVCICALTNKALMEIAQKDAIKNISKSGKVYKTNLTLNEQRENSQLKKSDSLTIAKSELLLATYYKLSDWFHPEKIDSTLGKLPIYDVLIIEEASQSFLTTIAAFKRLGKKILIVGDPMQLPPIVLNENLAHNIHPLMKKYADGLSAYVANVSSSSFMLQETFRLSEKAAKLTSIFYNKPLKSKQLTRKHILIDESLSKYIDDNGGSKITYLPILSNKTAYNDAISLCRLIVKDITLKNESISIALLSPFKKTILSLQESIASEIKSNNVMVIETIDRIQGVTVDFCIIILTLDNPSFALNLNRINVATSRAKSGTLIITDKEFVKFKGIHPKVTNYLNSLEII